MQLLVLCSVEFTSLLSNIVIRRIYSLEGRSAIVEQEKPVVTYSERNRKVMIHNLIGLVLMKLVDLILHEFRCQVHEVGIQPEVEENFVF